VSGLIILPGSNDSARSEFAKDLNRIVKKFRGVNRPFVTLIVEDNGHVTVLSNMDKHAEKVSLLSQTAASLKKAQ
jgi:hypothetical protein